jgi:uncharacterized LabA/DUF88 family protein
MKTVILIDGQNLYYNLKNINLIERNIRWDLVFKSLLNGAGDELLRTYWFRPQKILDTFYSTESMKNHIIYKKYNTYCGTYKTNPAAIPQEIMAKINAEVKICEDWLKAEKTRFSQIEYNYDELALEFDDIEIVKNGIVKVNPYSQEFIGEKGVDISLAVKMIALSVEKKCEKIILISGDYDYAEAIKFVKNNMTKIHIVKIHKGHPPTNKSVSRDLAVLADRVIDVFESELKSTFKK